MADFVFNRAKGRAVKKVDDGATFSVLLLQSAEDDEDLMDYENVADLLAAPGNSEANFDNYSRQVLSNVTPFVNYESDRAEISADNPMWISAGGSTNNSLVKAVIFEVGGSDADSIPITAHDYTPTTDGSDLVLQFPQGGFYRAQ